jgi:hypothetical protein
MVSTPDLSVGMMVSLLFANSAGGCKYSTVESFDANSALAGVVDSLW